MDIGRLRRAIDRVGDDTVVMSARQITYLRTYPALIELAATSSNDKHRHFLQLATAAYGWMPRIVRVDSDHLDDAVVALGSAVHATPDGIEESLVKPIAACLYSVVGASKVLHFANPGVFPIWDTKVERVWRRRDPTQNHMSQPTNYVRYAAEVHQLMNQNDFDTFFSSFEAAHEARLRRLAIPHYRIGKVRAVEAATFELSGGEYEDA